MRILFICGAVIVAAAAGLLIYCLYFYQAPSPTLTVTNNFSQPIARVVLKDGKGVICTVTNVPPGARQRCSGVFRGDGPVYFELQAAKLKKSSLIGFAKPGMNENFDVELNRDGTVGWGATVVGFAIQPNKQH